MSSKMKKVKSLRKKYPRFVYDGYSFRMSGSDLKISFDFSIEPGIRFNPKVVIKDVKKSQINSLDKKILNNLIFHLGLIEMLSYWKATVSPLIEIKAGKLSKDQIKWWKNLVIKGMGQFFYENGIDWRGAGFLKIESEPKDDSEKYLKKLRNQFLLGVGGGKDSPVTLEVLKRTKKPISCFSLNPTPAARKIIKVSRCRKSVIVERKIDKKLIELNRKGFLNGHTPFSAYLAFLSAILAVIFDYKYVVLSNERSSEEGNLQYLGEIINHQYSKSFDFEERFRSYSKRYLVDDLDYFSFLRPLYEIQIAKIFSKYPKYFKAFLSCNEAFKTFSGRKRPTGRWCSACSKCLFVYACLYPFLNKFQLRKIFGQNLFRKIGLIPVMEQLTGERDFKPFECVGAEKESLVAFYLGWKKTHRRGEIPFLLKHFEKKILPQYPDLEKETKALINSWNNHNNLPKDLKKLLWQAIRT